MKYRTSDGVELYFELVGEGKPCLYLHGGPGYWSKSFQHFSGKIFEEHLQMVYLDQRGCGRSEHSPTQDYSLNRLIDDIEELRVFLGIEEWFVLGHSFGGILAVNYTLRYPERILRLILSNATLNMFNSFEYQIKRGSDNLGIKGNELLGDDINILRDTYYSILSLLLEKGEYYKYQYKDLKNKNKVDLVDQDGLNSDPKFQQYVFSSNDYFQDFTTVTVNIQKPVLIIAGKFDHAVGPKHHLLFKFPNPIVEVLNSAHHPYIENELEFTKVILQFVNQ